MTALLGFLLYCGGLEQNLQDLRGLGAFSVILSFEGQRDGRYVDGDPADLVGSYLTSPCALPATLGVVPDLLPQFSPSSCAHLTPWPPFLVPGPARTLVPLV